ncbi:neuron navigator 3-like, partial [Neolamprologus brichardi]|uniref:neuron navigator 3-like n=1 Tax=Neolamprologus brichardi TaxID=32507 RepID=UPI0003EBEA47
MSPFPRFAAETMKRTLLWLVDNLCLSSHIRTCYLMEACNIALIFTLFFSIKGQTVQNSTQIRKLRRELDASQEKVATLTSQLAANAHLVAAFEKSLSNMTCRLQSLTMTAEQKAEAEIILQLKNELREKELKLTDIRLEALSSAHHLDQIREAMNRMQ